MTEEKPTPLVEIHIPKAAILYPGVYEGREWEEQGVRFGVGFTTDDTYCLQELHENQIYRNSKGSFNTNSRFRPLVTEHNGDYAALKRAFEIADLRNIKRDRLLIGVEAYLHLRVFSYNVNGRKGNGIVLLGLSIDAAPLEDKARNFTP